jgi:glycolate oxidase FAD binding subunit
MQEVIEQFSATLRQAAQRKSPVRVRGGGSKDFYGLQLKGDILDTTSYQGIVDYEPTELVLTARAGTRLSEIEQALRDKGQMLAFEPPHFGSEATLGGCVAAGLSGPRRAYSGAVRDFVLGVRILDAKGQDLTFGGRVMKNVAGYDVSRLIAGSLGTLGLILDVSLKVLPLPREEATLRLEMSETEAIQTMNRWAALPFPISGTCYVAGSLWVRLSGAAPALAAAEQKLGGEVVARADWFWNKVKEHTLEFFRPEKPLWRFSVKPTAPRLNLPGSQLIEWNGALRWLAEELNATEAREVAKAAGGHATLFRGGNKNQGVFQALSPGLWRIHQRLKKTLDPTGILNPGRMYEGL